MPSPQIEGDPTKVLHRIEDDLTGTLIEDLATDSVTDIESYLAKYLAFLVYLDEVEPDPDKVPHLSVERPVRSTREREIGSLSLATAEVTV